MRNQIRLMTGLLLCVAVCVAATAGCRRTESARKPVKPVQVQEVRNYSPGGQSGEGERYSAGILPSMQMELAFKYGGFLGEIHRVGDRYIQEGDAATRGTVLGRLRNDEFAGKVKQAEAQLAEAQATVETHRAQLSEAEAALRQAERDLERATKLLESQSLTKPEYEGARTRVELAQARAEAIRSQGKVIQAKIGGAQALLTEARLAEQDAVLRAPFDCYVLKRLVEPGALIVPGRPVFVVAERRSVKALFGVPDSTVQNIRMGTVLTLTTEALPGKEFQGRISRISPAADPRSRVFDVEVAISRPPEQLRPGMIASLTLPAAGSSSPVLVVPINAIVRLKQSPDRYAVNIVTEQDGKTRARQIPVSLGEAFGNMIAIKEGLSLGQRVVVSGSAMIEEGEEVRIIP